VKEEFMPLMSIEDLERDSKVSRFTWRSWIRAGKVPALRLGRRVLVDEKDYQRFLKQNLKPSRAGTGE
jgi:excisionase family DNA binding protein